MSTKKSKTDYGFLPFSLASKGRMISLKDVQVYHGKRLIDVISYINAIFIEATEINSVVAANDLQSKRDKITLCFRRVLAECEQIPLPLTAMLAKRFIDEIEQINEENSLTKTNELEDRFMDELQSIGFFMVKPARLMFYENSGQAGEQFKNAFPLANAELIEAGNCFTLDRYTACVAHLMRSLEIVLKVLHHSLGLQMPEKSGEKTWGKILERIEKKIVENNSQNLAGWSNEKNFYQVSYALLAAIKAPYRDSTMHVESIYGEQSADDVFRVTTAFLRHIANKLSE